MLEQPVSSVPQAARAEALSWVLDCGIRYWRSADQRAAIAGLLGPHTQVPMPPPLLRYVWVPLPDWAADLGVGSPPSLLIDACCLGAPAIGARSEWQTSDWAAAAWLHLTGAHERASEAHRGSALSYAGAIKNSNAALYDHAWVNRIFLFLRRQAARAINQTESEVFGNHPASEVILTHDVDAIRLTPEIRLKQSVFQLINSARELSRARLASSLERVGNAARFLVSRPDWLTFDEIRRLEEKAGVRSILHFYAGRPGWQRGVSPALLLDPGYDVADPALLKEFARFRDGGWKIGLHGSWRTWQSAQRLGAERKRIIAAAGSEVRHTRQHWLRFSWSKTWQAQEAAGLDVDATLGFNDRPGFRNGAALAIHPWDHSTGRPRKLTAIPMILMDSHFYDYQMICNSDRFDAIKRWLDEVRLVGGTATVNWHTHTIVAPYGWGEGYRGLLQCLD